MTVEHARWARQIRMTGEEAPVSKKTLEFSIRSVKQGRRLYGAGLKHRMLTLPVDPELAHGDAVTIRLHLAITRDTFELPAKVVHCGGSATIVQVDSVPAKIYAVIGELPPTEPPGAALAETVESVPVAIGTTEATRPASSVEDDRRGATTTPGSASAATPAPAATAPSSPSATRPAPPGETSAPGGTPPARVATARSAGPATPESPPGDPARSSSSFRLRGPRKGSPPSAGRPPASASPGPAAVSPPPAGAPRAPDPETALPIPGKPGQLLPATPTVVGSLEDRGMADVFMDLLKQTATGVLVVDGYKERYWGFLVQGRPVRYTREPPTRAEALDFHFSRAQLLEPPVLERVRQLSELLGVSLDDVILSRGLLTEAQVSGVLKQCATQVTDRLMGVNFGKYRFFAMDDVPDLLRGDPADVMGVLWERSRARFAGRSEKQVKQMLEDVHKQHVLVTELGRELVHELTLPRREQILVERYLRGGWQVAELVARIEVPRRDLLEVIFTLEALGLVTLSEREGDSWQLARAERFLIDREDYMGKDHFAFVEAHWTCLEQELIRACDKVERKLSDPVLDELELDEVGAMRDAIRAKLTEVRRIFVDTEALREYRGTLVERGKARQAAELFHRQGEMALFKGEGDLARECFERVQEVDPGGGQSTLRLARAKRVLQDLGRGVITQAVETDGDEDVLGMSPEDLDKT